MSQNYYKIIDGHKYDSEIIGLADQAVAGQGDGRISLEDAKLMLAGVKDANKYTDIEKTTMRYIRDHYRFTPASNRWFRTQIRSWAATRGWAGHFAEKDKDSAEDFEAETATADDNPPPVGISGGPESPQSHEQTPPPTPTTSPAPPVPASPQAEAPRAGSRAKWLIPLAAGGTIMAVIALLVFWPSAPTVEAPVREAPQSPAQTGVPVPAPAKAAGTKLQAPHPPDAAATVGEKSQAVEAASAARETAPVARVSQAPGAAAPGVQGGTHRVERGESLWAIAARWYNDARLWPRIFRANRERIPNPDLIHPGLQITVPALQ